MESKWLKELKICNGVVLLLGLIWSGVSGASVDLKLLQGQDVLSNSPRVIDVKKVKKATVIVFLSTRCPCSNSHHDVLKTLAKQYRVPDFQFFAVHSNADESEAEARNHFRHANFSFPVIQDDAAQIANELGALSTPHVYVLDPQGEILFQGGVDDSHIAGAAKKHYLERTLHEISTDQPVSVSRVRVLGCRIERP